MVRIVGKQGAKRGGGRFAFAIAALSFLFLQTLAFSHDVKAEHDVSKDNLHCTLCAHSFVKDDITTSPAFEYLIPVFKNEYIPDTAVKAVTLSLVLFKSPRAPPSTI